MRFQTEVVSLTSLYTPELFPSLLLDLLIAQYFWGESHISNSLHAYPVPFSPDPFLHWSFQIRPKAYQFSPHKTIAESA